MNVHEQIRTSAEVLGIALDDQQIDKLVRFAALLRHWNKHYNLISSLSSTGLITRHILDSLAAVPYLSGNNIADIGSGGGLPGIPLAISYPQRHFSLIESNGKKCRFMTQVKIELQLENVTILNSRVETLAPGLVFDTITTRAFASLQDTLELVDDLLSKEGYLLCLKGKQSQVDQELLSLGAAYTHEIIEMNVPGLDEQRLLVKLKKRDVGG